MTFIDHRHLWGPVTHSRMAGTPHRPCVLDGCTVISLDLDDGPFACEEPGCTLNEASHLVPARNIRVCPDHGAEYEAHGFVTFSIYYPNEVDA